MGFCAGTVKPVTRDIDMDIPAEAGEEVTLASGLIQDGTPQVSITWTFTPQGSSGAPYIIPAHETHKFTLTKETAGTYVIRIVHCQDQAAAVQNRLRTGKRLKGFPVLMIELAI